MQYCVPLHKQRCQSSEPKIKSRHSRSLPLCLFCIRTSSLVPDCTDRCCFVHLPCFLSSTHHPSDPSSILDRSHTGGRICLHLALPKHAVLTDLTELLVMVGLLYMAYPDGCRHDIYIPAEAKALPHEGSSTLVHRY